VALKEAIDPRARLQQFPDDHDCAVRPAEDDHMPRDTYRHETRFKLTDGLLEFQGKDHAFSIGGLGVGGIGVQKVRAVGAVYNLTDVSKFPGTYVQARTGVTVGTGKNVMSLSNEHGVILELRASTRGAALSVGVDGLVVKMK
jgi:hypothetical protein